MAAAANCGFSRLLRAVREGRSYVDHGAWQPVAQNRSRSDGDATAAGAQEALLARLHAEPMIEIGRWTRDELYEDAR